MTRLLTALLFLSLAKSLTAQNLPPVINNLNVTVGPSNQMTITYDLEDAENDDVDVTFRVSDNNGETFDINASGATGEIGYPVASGTGKSINWDFTGEISMDGNYRIMLVADDRQPVDIQAIVDQVDSTRLKSDLEEIVGVRHRTAGTAHLEDVRNMLRERFESHDLETETLTFNWQGVQGENIVGRKRGLMQETALYIVDGHYDTEPNTPGADDNGSAIAGVLEALRVLAPYSFQKSIKFIGFDLEEEGLVGSGNFVNNGGLKSYESVEGVLNFEMIGYFDNTPNSQSFPAGFSQLYPEVYNEIRNDGFRGNFITNVGIEGHPGLNVAFEASAERYVPDLKVVSILAPEQWLLFTPDLGRSDHAPFWLAGDPALMLTDGSNFRNPYYHTPNDTLGTLNFTFMSQVVKATVATIAELAGITNSTFAETDVDITTSTDQWKDCDVHIYPNPNSNFIKLNLPSCQYGDLQIDLFDLQGNILHHETLKGQVTQHDIPTSGLPEGSYLLKIIGEHSSISKRVIVKH